MYRIKYDYWTFDENRPQYGKWGRRIDGHVDGETLEQVCQNFDTIRYRHDVVENSTIEFIKIVEIA